MEKTPYEDSHVKDLVHLEEQIGKLLGGLTRGVVGVGRCKIGRHILPRLKRYRSGRERQ